MGTRCRDRFAVRDPDRTVSSPRDAGRGWQHQVIRTITDPRHDDLAGARRCRGGAQAGIVLCRTPVANEGTPIPRHRLVADSPL